MGIKQKDSVFAAVTTVLEESGQEINGAVTLTKDQRSQVVSMVASSLMSGETEFSSEASAKYDTLDKVKSYTVGLVNNWLRKDTRLNGGSKYQPKNPGSRQGSSDPVIKELKKLLSTLTEEDQREAVQNEINTRQAELQASRQAAKKVSINSDLLPEHLRNLAS